MLHLEPSRRQNFGDTKAYALELMKTPQVTMEKMGPEQGFTMALIASILLLATGLGSAILTSNVLYLMFAEHRSLDWIGTTTRLPTLLQFIWFTMVLATAGIIVSLFIHGFRARWFWRCLVVASCMWIMSPPLHSVIGLISLIVLLNTRKYFPCERIPQASAP